MVWAQGPHIGLGLPMYVAIYRKPENGCEIENSACGKSGIMLRVKVVTAADEEKKNALAEDAELPHGAVVLRQLVLPWAGSKRIVCADS